MGIASILSQLQKQSQVGSRNINNLFKTKSAGSKDKKDYLTFPECLPLRCHTNINDVKNRIERDQKWYHSGGKIIFKESEISLL
jgi:hypothetical protein